MIRDCTLVDHGDHQPCRDHHGISSSFRGDINAGVLESKWWVLDGHETKQCKAY